MASIEEVRAGILSANDKASESLGALQQAHSALEQAQGELARVTEGSGQADVSEANSLLAQAVSQRDRRAAVGPGRDPGVRGRRRPAVTGSFDELRAGLAVVAQLLATAGQHTAQAGGLLDEALAELTRLSEQHSESLVPVPLQWAAAELGTLEQ